MGRRTILFFLMLSILFLFSCGMPTYHNFDHWSNTISTSSTTSVPGNTEHDYVAGFRVRVKNNEQDPALATIDPNSPSVLLMYSISPTYSGLTSAFNTNYRNSNNYYNGVVVSFDGGELANVSSTVDGETIHMYELTNESGNRVYSDPPEYLYHSLSLDTFYYFMIRQENDEERNGFYFVLDIYTENSDGYIGSVVLQRYNCSTFFSSTEDTGFQASGDYSYYDSTNEEVTMADYQINFHLSVNIMPGENATFNNLYWSSIATDSFEVR